MLDRGVIEYFGPLGLVRYSDCFSKKLLKLHSGFLYQYIFLAIVSLIFCLFLASCGDLFLIF